MTRNPSAKTSIHHTQRQIAKGAYQPTCSGVWRIASAPTSASSTHPAAPTSCVSAQPLTRIDLSYSCAITACNDKQPVKVDLGPSITSNGRVRRGLTPCRISVNQQAICQKNPLKSQATADRLLVDLRFPILWQDIAIPRCLENH